MCVYNMYVEVSVFKIDQVISEYDVNNIVQLRNTLSVTLFSHLFKKNTLNLLSEKMFHKT